MRQDIHTLTGAYAVDALSDDERAVFEEHLVACDACRQEVAELQATAARLGGSLHEPPPPELKGRVLAAIDRTRQEPPGFAEVEGDPANGRGGPVAPPVGSGAAVAPDDLAAARARRARTAPPWLLGVVGTAAGVLAIAVVGLGITVAGLEERLGEMEAAAGQLTEVMAAVDAETISVTADGTLLRIVMSPRRGEAVVLVDGMAPAPADHAYELWLIHDDVRVPAGVFHVDDRGRATRVVTGDMATVTAIGVTVEPAGGSPQPTSEPVMVVEMAG
jgi:anti-sigma-K factor RskA